MYQKLIKSKILPEFGRHKISNIARTDVQDLHNKITDTGATFQANRTLATLRAMFNFGMDRTPPLCTANPCERIKTNPEQPRKRYLSPEETARLMAVLDRYPHEQVVSLIRVMFWCGSRVTETMVARWADINLTTGIWIKPGATVKTKSDHEVPLSKPVLTMLRAMRKAAPHDDRVWPGMKSSVPAASWESRVRSASMSRAMERNQTSERKAMVKKRAPKRRVWNKGLEVGKRDGFRRIR